MQKNKNMNALQKKNINESNQSIPNQKFQLFLTLQAIFTFACFIHAWTLQYKSDLGSDGFINRVSYITADKPWMPPGTDSSSLLYLHYFGDWVLNVAYGGIQRPYDPSLDIPAQFAPVGLLFFNLAYLIGYKYSYALLLILTLYIWIRIAQKLFPYFQYFYITLILIFVVFLTMPSIIAFDRGGTQLFCVGLAGLAYLNKLDGHNKKAFILYLLAVSMKPYLVFFTLIFLIESQRKLILRIKSVLVTGISLLFANLLLLPLYADNIITGIRDEFNAIARFAGDWGIPWIMDGGSMTSFISKTYEMIHGSTETITFMENFLPFWPRVLATLFLALLLVTLLNPNVAVQIKIILIISTTSLVSPFSGPYTLAWLSLAFCYILSEIQKGFNIEKLNLPNKISLYSLITASYLGLAPYFGFLPKFSDVARHVPGNYLYVPFILIALIVSAINFPRNRLSIQR
jgi:hypothetical protein